MIEYSELYNLTKDFQILYVEDDEAFRRDTSEILSYFFANITVACNGEEAYQKYLEYEFADKKHYDLVITDISMPKMNGLELTKKIYQQNKNQSLIVISAYDESKYLLEFVNLGIEYFLVKPFELNTLFEVLYKAVININASQTKSVTKEIVQLGSGLFWDSKKMALFKNRQEIKLTKKEILLMKLLLKNRNKIITFEEIYHTLWGEKSHLATTATLNPIISRFKKKLSSNLIKSIYGFGYKLELV